MPQKKTKLAFTLIELLVIIAILGLFASIVLVTINRVRVQARDARRISETSQINKAVEIYYASHDNYPSNLDKMNIEGNWFQLLGILDNEKIIFKENFIAQEKAFLSSLILVVRAAVPPPPERTNPQDPLYPNRTYGYVASLDGQNFRIRAHLENLNNPVLPDGLTGSFLCSEYTTGETACDPSLGYYCLGPKKPFNPGTCD